MKIVVTGGAGFLGAELIAALLAAQDAGRPGLPDFGRIVSVDLAPCPVRDARVDTVTGDATDPALLAGVVSGEVAAVVHLAAVVSGQAEAEFDTGMRVNLDGTRALLDACRRLAAPPRLVFASSLAVFGGALPDPVPEAQALTPRSSYGTQKAMAELLVADCTRRGFVRGVALRLPTVVVRPGRPNAAASSFASSIIREPLAGQEAVLPVPETLRLWLSAPATVTANLVHALTLDAPDSGASSAINLPGLTVTVAEMLDSLGRLGGEACLARIRRAPDPRIAAIVESWPAAFDTARARGLGFAGDAGFDAAVADHIARFPPPAA
jgi:nucleoside-diphosphate-sugar epimerase